MEESRMKQPTRVCDLQQLREGEGHRVVVNGRPLALFLDQGRVYALDDRCPHREGQISRGRVQNGEAICTWRSSWKPPMPF